MATDEEIVLAEKKVDDNVELNAALTVLNNIYSGDVGIQIYIERGDEQFSLNSLLSKLQANSENEDTMITNIENHILALIGEDNVTEGTIRKEIQDLIDLNDADIAAT